MQIPEMFKEAIKDAFYDEDIEIWETDIVKDDEGAVVENGRLQKIDAFKGNFQFTTREYIRQEYGKEIDVNAVVTCDKTIAKIGDILVYNNNDYEIKSKIISDSHTTLLVNGGDEDV